MATIKASTNESVYRLDKFLGLNENPSGDTKLKFGEASVCQNWKVTRDRNLQKRPGSKTLYDLATDEPIQGMWFGNINGHETGLAASGDYLYKFYYDDFLETPTNLGAINTDNRVSFFAFSNIVYILNGKEYYYYDGTTFDEVDGYRPLIALSRTPDGSASTLHEGVNKLNGTRRVWFSPDGVATEFVLPENDLKTIDYVQNTSDGSTISPSTYTADIANGKVTFTGSAPAAGTNTIEIGYTVKKDYRTDVTGMTNFELFLGAQDTAVFLYGNGTNKALYSSIDYWGQPRADYFPDLNEMAVADDNTPITGMIRHFSQLICYKTTSVYTIHFGLITKADQSQEYGFYVTPVNREIGNAALGQVRLVLNSPFALFGDDLYEWKSNSRYSANLSSDERNAQRISDRIYATLGTFDTPNCYCYDDNPGQEYYICYNNQALVYNYPADSWYYYTGLNIHSMCNIYEQLLFGTEDGRICELSENYLNDDGEEIDCNWESGSLDFGKNYLRKFMSELWVSMKPQAHSKVVVTAQTDKKSEFTERTIESRLATFDHMDFTAFSFSTNRKPQVKKLKIKAKKFAFLKIIFKTKDPYTSATVLSVDPKIRETGYVK